VQEALPSFAELVAEEDERQFSSATNDDAWALGCALVELAQGRACPWRSPSPAAPSSSSTPAWPARRRTRTSAPSPSPALPQLEDHRLAVAGIRAFLGA
jgi:hypothetical protein